MHNNTYDEALLSGDMTLGEFMKSWIYNVKAYDVKPTTVSNLQSHYNVFSKYSIFNRKVSDLTRADVRNFLFELNNTNLAQGTIKVYTSTIHDLLSYAYTNDYTENDLSDMTHRINKRKSHSVPKTPVAYTPDDQKLLHDYVDYIRKTEGSHKTLRVVMANAMEFLLETGLRAGEMLALEWSDVDIDRRRINVHRTTTRCMQYDGTYIQDGAKTASSNRVIPMSKHAQYILASLKSFSDKGFIFSVSGKKSTHYCVLAKYSESICNECMIEYRGVHAFRHTFATNQYHKGTDVKILSKLLGHSNTTITLNTYIHLYGDGFDDMLQAVD